MCSKAQSLDADSGEPRKVGAAGTAVDAKAPRQAELDILRKKGGRR